MELELVDKVVPFIVILDSLEVNKGLAISIVNRYRIALILRKFYQYVTPYMYRKRLLVARRAKAALSTLCFIELIYDIKFAFYKWDNSHLSDPIVMSYDLLRIALVM